MADIDDSIIIQFVESIHESPATASVLAAALVASVGPQARQYASNPFFGALAGHSREAVVSRVQTLIRNRKLRIDHSGIRPYHATPAVPSAISPSFGEENVTPARDSSSRFSGSKRTATAAGIALNSSVAPRSRLTGPPLQPSCSSGSATLSPMQPTVSASSYAIAIPKRSRPADVSATVDTAIGPLIEADAALETTLSVEQRAVYDLVVEEGRSIFFTGSAGTGKSHVLKAIIEGLRKKYAEMGIIDGVYVTAPTGIAACNIGGTTIHSFAGLPMADLPLDELVTHVERKSTTAAKRWKSCYTLVIDEISMLDGHLLDTLEHLARRIRKNDRCFGGIQLVLTGDFCQLPPVGVSDTSTRGKFHKHQPATCFCFEAKCWNKILYAQVMLTQVFRQKDPEFIDLLNGFRMGEVTPRSLALLSRCGSKAKDMKERLGILPTKIFALNKDVDRINDAELAKCPGPLTEYAAQDDGEGSFLDSLKKNCPAPEVLRLRIGAQVMLLKNLDAVGGLVNGSRGVVSEFIPNPEGSWPPTVPVVSFAVGDGTVRVPVLASDWNLELGTRIMASRTQVPLKLAYALSIHKSQGMTISSLEVSLEGVFEYGQAYVALSRATSLDHLIVTGFKKSVVRAHPKVIAFYKRLCTAASVVKAQPLAPKPVPIVSNMPPTPTAAIKADIAQIIADEQLVNMLFEDF